MLALCLQREALQRTAAEPETVDATIRFDAGTDGADGLSYTVRGNHTDLPSTRLTYNEFDLLPDPQYRLYWLFANIQQTLDRSVGHINLIRLCAIHMSYYFFFACLDLFDRSNCCSRRVSWRLLLPGCRRAGL